MSREHENLPSIWLSETALTDASIVIGQIMPTDIEVHEDMIDTRRRVASSMVGCMINVIPAPKGTRVFFGNTISTSEGPIMLASISVKTEDRRASQVFRLMAEHEFEKMIEAAIRPDPEDDNR